MQLSTSPRSGHARPSVRRKRVLSHPRMGLTFQHRGCYSASEQPVEHALPYDPRRFFTSLACHDRAKPCATSVDIACLCQFKHLLRHGRTAVVDSPCVSHRHAPVSLFLLVSLPPSLTDIFMPESINFVVPSSLQIAGKILPHMAPIFFEREMCVPAHQHSRRTLPRVPTSSFPLRSNH